MLLVDFQKTLSNFLVIFLKLENHSKLSRIFRLYILKFFNYCLLILFGKVNDTLPGPFAWMHQVNLLICSYLVFNHWPPNYLSISLKRPSLKFGAYNLFLVHDLIEVVAADGLAVHFRDGSVEELGATAEHYRNVTYHVAIRHPQSQMLFVIDLITYCEFTLDYKLNFFHFFHVFEDNFSCAVEAGLKFLQKLYHERTVDSIFPVVGTNSFILIV